MDKTVQQWRVSPAGRYTTPRRFQFIHPRQGPRLRTGAARARSMKSRRNATDRHKEQKRVDTEFLRKKPKARKEVRIKVDVKKVSKINVAEQTFTVQLLLEASWQGDDIMEAGKSWVWDDSNDSAEAMKLQSRGVLRLNLKDDTDAQGKVTRDFWAPRLKFRNRNEVHAEECWYAIYPDAKDPSKVPPVVCFRWELHAEFNELMELQWFPLDSQPLQMQLTSGWEANLSPHVFLVKNMSGNYKSICNIHTFMLRNEYELLPHVRFEETLTSAEESANGPGPSQALAGPSSELLPSLRLYRANQAVLPWNMLLEDVTASQFQPVMSA